MLQATSLRNWRTRTSKVGAKVARTGASGSTQQTTSKWSNRWRKKRDLVMKSEKNVASSVGEWKIVCRLKCVEFEASRAGSGRSFKLSRPDK